MWGPTGIVVGTWDVGACWDYCWYRGGGGLLRLLLVRMRWGPSRIVLGRWGPTGIVVGTWEVGGLLRLLLVHRRLGAY